MRIGFDAKRAFHNASGLGNYSRFVIRILAAHFPEESLLLFNPKPNDNWDVVSHDSIQEILPPKSSWSSFWRSFQGAKKVEQHDLDIYHGLSNELPFGIAKSKAKKIVTIHDVIFKRFPELYKAADRLIYDKKMSHTLNAADTVIAISKTTKEDIVRYYNTSEKKIKVIYQGCNPLFYQRAAAKQLTQTQTKFGLPSSFFICVGTIEERKNGLSLLKAMEELSIDLPLVFVGRSTKYKSVLEKYVSDNHSLTDKVYFIENATNEELCRLYQLARFSVYPSVFEGFGIPILESIAAGTPVITNEEGCFKEAGGNAALYCNTSNTSELSSAIKRICSDNTLLENLVLNGTEHLKNFEEQKLAEHHIQLYRA